MPYFYYKSFSKKTIELFCECSKDTVSVIYNFYNSDMLFINLRKVLPLKLTKLILFYYGNMYYNTRHKAKEYFMLCKCLSLWKLDNNTNIQIKEEVYNHWWNIVSIYFNLDISFIDLYESELFWCSLSANKNLTIDIINKYYKKLDLVRLIFSNVPYNNNIPNSFSMHFYKYYIKKYEDIYIGNYTRSFYETHLPLIAEKFFYKDDIDKSYDLCFLNRQCKKYIENNTW